MRGGIRWGGVALGGGGAAEEVGGAAEEEAGGGAAAALDLFRYTRVGGLLGLWDLAWLGVLECFLVAFWSVSEEDEELFGPGGL